MKPKKYSYNSTSPRPRLLTPYPPTSSFPLSEVKKLKSACYFRDYELGLCPILPSKTSSRRLCSIYLLRSTSIYQHTFLTFSCCLIFLSSFLEHAVHLRTYRIAATLIGGTFYLIDIALVVIYRLKNSRLLSQSTYRPLYLHIMTLVYLILHVLETLLSPKSQTFLLTSILKPILIIYSFPISTSTSSTTVYNQSPNLFRIFSLELGLIFCFSLAAVLLYSDDEYFKDLSHSFVTLFALSTTVNNPSSWIALYKRSPFNSLFFITFLTCSLFYVHSIVLGLVLNEYSKGFKTELDKKITNRERAVKMAYECLKRDSGKKNVDNEREDKSYVKRQDLKEALGYLRPHYTQSKLDRICKSYPENISRETFHRVVKKGISMRVTTQGRRRFMMLQKILSCFDENAYLMYVLRVGRETLRATAGPCLLNFMTLHLFNYVGIYLWASKVGDWLNGRGGEYYYLLNFNSYGEGLVTLFNLMVVNDWNQIAKVFTAISKESTTYTFFIAFQLIVSGVMVNVVKGFFVSAFIKNYEDDPSQSSKKKSSVRRSSTSKVAVFESAKREGSLREGNIESPDESEPLLTLAVSKRGGYIDTMENVVGVGVIGGSSAPPICTFNAETNQVLGFNPEFTINCEGINEKKMAGALVEAVVRGKTSWSFFEMGHEFTPIVTTIGGNVKIIILQH